MGVSWNHFTAADQQRGFGIVSGSARANWTNGSMITATSFTVVIFPLAALFFAFSPESREIPQDTLLPRHFSTLYWLCPAGG